LAVSVTNWKSPSSCGALYSEWSSPTKMYSSNNQRAGASDQQAEDYRGFGFDAAGADGVPAEATVVGIEWKVEGAISLAGASYQVSGTMIKGGAISGGEYNLPTNFTSTSDKTYTYGGNGYMMDTSLMGTDVRDNANFGIKLLAYDLTQAGQTFAGDWVAMRLHYITTSVLEALTLASSAQDVTISLIVSLITVDLSALTLAGSVPDATVSGVGVLSVVLIPVDLLATLLPVGVSVPGTATVDLSALTLAGSVPDATVSGVGVLSVVLIPVDLLATLLPVGVSVPGTATVDLSALTLATELSVFTISVGAFQLLLRTLMLAASASELSLVGGSVQISARRGVRVEAEDRVVMIVREDRAADVPEEDRDVTVN